MHKPDMAILPIGGHYTMGPRWCRAGGQDARRQAVVPVHYGTFPILAGTPDELRAELAAIGAAVEVVVARTRSRDANLMVHVRVADPGGRCRSGRRDLPPVRRANHHFLRRGRADGRPDGRPDALDIGLDALAGGRGGRPRGGLCVCDQAPRARGLSVVRRHLGLPGAGGDRSRARPGAVSGVAGPAAPPALRQRLRRHYSAQRRERGAASRDRNGA